MSKVSVIIRTKNEEFWLRTALFAVFNQDWDDLEVIVVDNESSDSTLEIAERFGCVVRKISDEDFNYSKALNIGIEASSGDLLVMLSAHCIPCDDSWLRYLVAPLIDPLVGGCYGRQVPCPDSKAEDKRDLWITFGSEKRVQKKDFFFHNANSVIRRGLWETEKFCEMANGLEDQRWAKAIISRGYQIAYEPNAPVFHHHGIHHANHSGRAIRVVNILEDLRAEFIGL